MIFTLQKLTATSMHNNIGGKAPAIDEKVSSANYLFPTNSRPSKVSSISVR